MNKIVKLSILNILRNKKKNKIYMIIITLFMTIISIVFSISFLLNQVTREIISKREFNNEMIIEILNSGLSLSIEELSKDLISYEFIEKVDIIRKNDYSTESYIYITINKNIEDMEYILENYFEEKIGLENYININNNLLDNDIKIIKNINVIVYFIFFIILFLAFISINIIIKKSLDNRIREIAIYKSVGYKNKHLFRLIWYELLIVVIVSYIFSIILSILILNFLSRLSLDIVNIQLNIINLIWIYNFLLIIWILLVLCISCISMIKIKKIPIIYLLNQ